MKTESSGTSSIMQSAYRLFQVVKNESSAYSNSTGKPAGSSGINFHYRMSIYSTISFCPFVHRMLVLSKPLYVSLDFVQHIVGPTNDCVLLAQPALRNS